MSEQSLYQLYAEHTGKVSDKWSIYLSEYDRIFSIYRHTPISMLEIGIQNGGSLEVWNKYFSNIQTIIGCDINPDCSNLKYEDPKISVIVGDANTEETQKKILQLSPSFNIIIDDGSHTSSDIIESFAAYFPVLSNEGIFVVEDLHCSYWKEFEGGLFEPMSSIAFFKRLADIVNHEHWGLNLSRTDLLTGFFNTYKIQIDESVLQQIHSIEFINSICIIRKKAVENNILGTRFIAGLSAQAVQEPSTLHGTTATPPIQHYESITGQCTPLDEEHALLVGKIYELKQIHNENSLEIQNQQTEIKDLQTEIENLQDETLLLKQVVVDRETAITSLHNSLSWRITLPIRLVKILLNRIFRMPT